MGCSSYTPLTHTCLYFLSLLQPYHQLYHLPLPLLWVLVSCNKYVCMLVTLQRRLSILTLLYKLLFNFCSSQPHVESVSVYLIYLEAKRHICVKILWPILHLSTITLILTSDLHLHVMHHSPKDPRNLQIDRQDQSQNQSQSHSYTPINMHWEGMGWIAQHCCLLILPCLIRKKFPEAGSSTVWWRKRRANLIASV